MMVDKKSNYIGIFTDFGEAVAYRLAVEQCLGWENCDSSSPAYQHIQRSQDVD